VNEYFGVQISHTASERLGALDTQKKKERNTAERTLQPNQLRSPMSNEKLNGLFEGLLVLIRKFLCTQQKKDTLTQVSHRGNERIRVPERLSLEMFWHLRAEPHQNIISYYTQLKQILSIVQKIVKSLIKVKNKKKQQIPKKKDQNWKQYKYILVKNKTSLAHKRKNGAGFGNIDDYLSLTRGNKSADATSVRAIACWHMSHQTIRTHWEKLLVYP